MSRSKKNAAASTTIAAVPNHIMSDILSRLPLNSIFACKRVCKVWRDLTLEPHFAKLHLSRSPLSLIFYRHANYNGDDDKNSPSSHFEIFQLHDPPYLCHQNATMKFKTGIHFPHRRIEIVASCNGLILLSNCCSIDDHVIAVCNPLRAQHFFLPKPPNLPGSKYYNYYGYGFGHSPATDQYKVVRFTSQTLDPSRLDFDIYTIGIDRKWRTIGNIGLPPAVYMSHLVFLNGAFHWIGSENENSRLICYFDIDKEQFGSFPLPSDIGNDTFPYLGVLDNWLYIQEDCSFNIQKIWVMKDYGDFWSWSLDCVIDGSFTRGFGTAKPLKMFKDGTLLMMFNKLRAPQGINTTLASYCQQGIKITLASYNPQTGVLKMIKHPGTLPSGDSVADVPCFFLPMDALN